MGDGGVACVPSLRFSISDTFCEDNVNVKMKKLGRRDRFSLKSGQKSEQNDDNDNNKSSEEFSVEDNNNNNYDNDKDEVEEGELGTWDNDDFFVEKPRKFGIRSEIEKGEFVKDRWRKGGDVEKEEFVSPGKWRKGKFQTGEYSSKNRDFEYSEFGYGKDEVEKGEFIPDRWPRNDVRDDNSYGKIRRQDKGWKTGGGRTGKYSSAEKEFNRNGNQYNKKSARWENNSRERTPRIGSKIVDEEGQQLNDEFSNGKNHGRESFPLGNRLKRHSVHTDSSDRKQHGEFNDYTPYKSRRVSDDGSRSTYSTEQSYKNSASARNVPSERYNSRNCDSPLSSKPAYDRHNGSPRQSERSPRDRARQYDYHDYDQRSPVRRDRSPYGRNRYYDNRNRSPSYSERSPLEQPRGYDRRERTPNLKESSPHNRPRSGNYRETSRKTGSGEKRKNHYENKKQEEKVNSREPSEREPQTVDKESEPRITQDSCEGSVEKSTYKEDVKQAHVVNGATEELLSMEEDMDICDTPPHVPEAETSVSTTGKWFYLDHLGMERGPSRLCDLKVLVDEGFLVSDHLIKHLDSQRWVTVENAVSPVVTTNFSSSFLDTFTELVSPPEAPGNLLLDVGELPSSSNQVGEEALAVSAEINNDSSESHQDLQIDERVEALFDGVPSIPGKELETVAEALQMTFSHGELQRWGYSEGLLRWWNISFLVHSSYPTSQSISDIT